MKRIAIKERLIIINEIYIEYSHTIHFIPYSYISFLFLITSIGYEKYYLSEHSEHSAPIMENLKNQWV